MLYIVLKYIFHGIWRRMVNKKVRPKVPLG